MNFLIFHNARYSSAQLQIAFQSQQLCFCKRGTFLHISCFTVFIISLCFISVHRLWWRSSQVSDLHYQGCLTCCTCSYFCALSVQFFQALTDALWWCLCQKSVLQKAEGGPECTGMETVWKGPTERESSQRLQNHSAGLFTPDSDRESS